jgi:hypothetical protein
LLLFLLLSFKKSGPGVAGQEQAQLGWVAEDGGFIGGWSEGRDPSLQKRLLSKMMKSVCSRSRLVAGVGEACILAVWGTGLAVYCRLFRLEGP